MEYFKVVQLTVKYKSLLSQLCIEFKLEKLYYDVDLSC